MVSSLFRVFPGSDPQDFVRTITGTTDTLTFVGELERELKPFQISRGSYGGSRSVPNAIMMNLEIQNSETVNRMDIAYSLFPSSGDIKASVYHSKRFGRERFAIYDARNGYYYSIKDKRSVIKNLKLLLFKGAHINAPSYR